MTSRPRRRRGRIEPTDEWEQIELLCGCAEQRDYELIRPLVLFGASADNRSKETGASSGRTLRRKAVLFEAEGIQSLFGSEAACRRRLPPVEVLGFASGVRHREEELRRAFFSSRFVRVLDALGYTHFRHWRVYGEEALAGREATLWLAAESLTIEHSGEPLSRYAVEVEAATGELRSVKRPRLFETSHVTSRPQRRLFALDALGEGEWLKAMKLHGYAPRTPRGARQLQQALFPYAEAL